MPNLFPPARRSLALLLSVALLLSAFPTFLPNGAAPALAAESDLVLSAPGIDGFGLDERKLFYWGNSLCSGPFLDRAQIARRRLFSSIPDQVVQPFSCDVAPVARPDVVRDDYFFYYFAGPNGTRLVRKLAVAAADTPPTVIVTVPAVTTRAGLDLRDGYLYWSSYIPATNASVIYRMKADLSEQPLSITGGTGEITWLRSLRLRNGNSVEDALVWRTDAGMYRWRSDTNPPFGAVLQLAPGTFYDGALAFTGSPVLSNSRSYLLAARSNGLLRIDLFSGQVETIYAAPTGRSIRSVAVDPVPPPELDNQRQIYLSEQAEQCVGGDCATIYRIKRRPLNATNWDVVEWLTMVDTLNGPGGVNLHSNGKRLYFRTTDRSPTEIRAIPVEAQPILLNIAALGLEAVQAVQNMENAVDLVAGRETLVRGYAYLTVNTSSLEGVRPSARLHAWRDGAYLGAVESFNRPLIDTTSNMVTLRSNPDRSFLFDLPFPWLATGQFPLAKLRLELEVNHDGLVEETLLNPGDDNRFPTSQSDQRTTLDLVRTYQPCLVMMPVLAKGAPQPGFSPALLPQIIQRARSFLPVADLKVYLKAKVISDDGKPYDLDDDDSSVLDHLFWIWLTSDHPPGCVETFYVGMIHPNADWEGGGLARLDSSVSLFKLSTNNQWTLNAPAGGATLAHELGHNYGLNHVQCADDPSDWKDQTEFDVVYPYPVCQISFSAMGDPKTHFGFDRISYSLAKDEEARRAAVIRPDDAADIMSYKRPRWASAYFWQNLLSRMPIDPTPNNAVVAAQVAADGPRLVVQGRIFDDGARGRFQMTQLLPEAALPRGREAALAAHPAQASGRVALRLRNAAGALLAEHPLRLSESGRHGRVREETFSGMAPVAPGATLLELVSGSRVLDSRELSVHTPTVTLAPPQIDLNRRTVTLSWQASDADNEPLRTTVQYSHDGQTWQTLLVEAEATQVTLSTIGLAGGANPQFRVLTSDGVKVGVSPGMTLVNPNIAPVVQITGIVSGQRFPTSAVLSAYASAIDLEDGPLMPEWTLSGPSAFTATQPKVTMTGLEPGAYTLELSATDSGGKSSSTAVNFTIEPLIIPNRSAPVLDGKCDDPVYDEALLIVPFRPTSGNVQKEHAWLVHANDALYVCLSSLRLPKPESSIGQAGVRFDLNASGEPLTQPGDIGFLVRTDGEIAQLVDNGDGFRLHTNPQVGYQARIVMSGGAWSAEMRIADTLLGGNPRRTRMMINFDAVNPSDSTASWPAAALSRAPNTWTMTYFGSAPMAANLPPLANAGLPAPYWPANPQTFYLDAAASVDPEEDALSYRWKQISGPPVRLRNADQALASFDADPVTEPTMLVFELTVNDGGRNSPPQTVEVQLLPALGASGIPVIRDQAVVYLPLLARR
jgi:hypothetical protein